MAPQHTRSTSGSSLHQQQHQQPSAYGFEALQNPSLPPNPQQNHGAPPQSARKPEFGLDDGDIAMEDADPYNRMKYPSRTSHSQRPSQYLAQDDSTSTAARRYSPMNTFSPTSPYVASSPQQSNHAYNAYTPQNQSARQSPNRGNPYSTPSTQYYPSNRM